MHILSAPHTPRDIARWGLRCKTPGAKVGLCAGFMIWATCTGSLAPLPLGICTLQHVHIFEINLRRCRGFFPADFDVRDGFGPAGLKGIVGFGGRYVRAFNFNGAVVNLSFSYLCCVFFMGYFLIFIVLLRVYCLNLNNLINAFSVLNNLRLYN